MCLVIDTCCLAAVFDKKNSNHSKFSPILRWLRKGRGKMIFGGKKYLRELAKAPRYNSLVVELQRRGKVVILPGSKIDQLASSLKAQVSDGKFNDEHLIAIVIVSGACVICTEDKVAHRYLKDLSLYPHGSKPPKIYQDIQHRELLCDKHIVGVCVD